MLRRNALLLTTTATTSRVNSTLVGKRATASVSAPNGSFYFNNFINSGEMMQVRVSHTGVQSTVSERSQKDQSHLLHNGLGKVAWHKKPTDVFKRGLWSWKPAKLSIMMNAPPTQKEEEEEEVEVALTTTTLQKERKKNGHSSGDRLNRCKGMPFLLPPLPIPIVRGCAGDDDKQLVQCTCLFQRPDQEEVEEDKGGAIRFGIKQRPSKKLDDEDDQEDDEPKCEIKELLLKQLRMGETHYTWDILC